MAFSKFLDPKNDYAFKRIFGTERNKDILQQFLNDIFEFRGDDVIASLRFLQTVQDPDIASKKQSIVDVLCEDQVGTQYIIEMQVAKTKGFEKRAQYYAAKAYSTQINRGDDYSRLKRIIFLAITDYVMFADKAAYKSDHITLDKESHEHDLQDFSFTFIELPKFSKGLDELASDKEKWIYFFKHADETAERDVATVMGDNSSIGKAYEELNQYSWSEIERNTYERELKNERDARAIEAAKIEDAEYRGMQRGIEQGVQQGMQRGIEQGIEQGVQQALHTIVKSMRAQNMSVDAIAAVTGLTKDDILLIE